jgi:hypothetical protein
VRKTGGERAINSTKITPIKIFCPEPTEVTMEHHLQLEM